MTEDNAKQAPDFAGQLIDALLSAVQGSTPQEAAARNADGLPDVIDLSAAVQSCEWPDEISALTPQVIKALKDSSMDTRREMKLSFPPSHFSAENDPVSLICETVYKTAAPLVAALASSPEVYRAFDTAIAERGLTDEDVAALTRRVWDVGACTQHLPEIAEVTKEIPAYEDYNENVLGNYDLIDAKRKIEHTTGGRLVEKDPLDENATETEDVGQIVTDKVMLESALASLDEADRALLLRHAAGETYAELAADFGYKTAGGVQKRIERIRQKLKDFYEKGA